MRQDQLTREGQQCDHGLYFGATCYRCEIARLQEEQKQRKDVERLQKELAEAKQYGAERDEFMRRAAAAIGIPELKHPEWLHERLEERAASLPAASLPDDIRAAGWKVDSHYDFLRDDVPRTFWCFRKGECVAFGDGRTDAEALDVIRSAIATPMPDFDRCPPMAALSVAYETPEYLAVRAVCLFLQFHGGASGNTLK